MKKTLTIGIAAAVLLFTHCTTDRNDDLHYVNLSQVSCTFLGEGSEPLAVTVKASPGDWTAEPGATWVKIERTDDRTLTVTAEDNTSGAERSTAIVITAGQASSEIRVNQLPPDNEFARYRTLPVLGAMSPNGRYVGYYESSIAADDSWLYSPVILDLETGEIFRFGPFPEALYYMTDTMCITDQGLLFIYDGSNGGMIVIDTDGNITHPESPEGFGKPQVQASSADGRYWVGFASESAAKEGQTTRMTRPLLWTDGVPEVLPMPDKNYRGEEFWVGIMARGMSADGSVVYGTSWENSDFGMVYWKDGLVDWVGKDVHVLTPVVMQMGDGTEYDYNLANGMVCTANLTNISATGKWIAGSYRTEAQSENKISVVTTQTAAFYNTETETTTIVDDYGESTGTHVTDDGIAFIGIGSLGISSSVVYDLNTHTDLGSMEDWVYDNYGIIIPSGFVNQVAPDGRFVLGTRMQSSAMGASFASWYIAPPIEK